MSRLDVPVDDQTAQAVQFAARARGQSVAEFTRRAVSVQVGAEAGPYRFSGSIGAPSFLRDLAATAGWETGDAPVEIGEAFDRLRKFERWSEDVAKFAAQTTTTASQIVPPGYQAAVSIAMTIDRPLASACETAALTGSAPFNVPRATGDGTVAPGRAEGAQPAGSDPVFGTTAITPIGLAGKIDLTRELVDSASPGGDLIALSILRQDWYRQAEARIYTALQTAQSGTITNGIAAGGAQARVSTTPATNLLIDLKKAVLSYANVRRRKARNIIAGAAALDPNLGGLLGAESTSGDDTCLATILGARLNAAVNDFATGSTDCRVAILGADDVVNFESPLASFRFDEQSGPALVTAAVWAYHACVVARPLGVASIRFT